MSDTNTTHLFGAIGEAVSPTQKNIWPMPLIDFAVWANNLFGDKPNIFVDINKLSDSGLRTLRELDSFADWYQVYAFRISPLTRDVVAYTTKRRRSTEVIEMSQVLTVQNKFHQESIDAKADYFSQNGVTEAIVTVETLRGIYTDDGRQCYILKDGHHALLASYVEDIPIIFSIEDEDTLMPYDLLKEGYSVNTKMNGYILHAIWVEEFVGMCYRKRGVAPWPIPSTLQEILTQVNEAL